MTVLKVANDFSFLETDNLRLKLFLWENLRHRERGYFHNRRYKLKLWDGYVNFFDKASGKFLTGLLPEVRLACKRFNEPYELIDKRGEVSFACDAIDDQFLNGWLPKGEKRITLHDYQVDLVNQAIKHKRGVIHAPTSAGKSFMLLGILRALPPGTKALMLQNRKGLAVQNYEEISNPKWGLKNVGKLWGGKYVPGDIVVGTVQSIGHIEKELKDFQVLVVDEIHDMMSKIPKAVYRRLTNCSVRVALSATPFKFGEKDPVQKYYVKGFFGPVLKTASTETGVLTTKELQKRDILSKSKCVFYPINEPQIPHDVYTDAVTRGIAESWYFHDVVTRLAKTLKGRTLILVERLPHGDALHKKLPGSLWVQGKDDDATRKAVIEKLQVSKDDVIAIATQQIFNTGINVKCHNLINAASGQAEHMIIQRMGRGLRTADDKNILQYYDFVFNINDYLLQHSNKRVKILKEQGHDVVVRDDFDF